MVLITAMVAVIWLQASKTMKRTYTFIDTMQHELSFLSTKVALTLHEVNEFIGYLKTRTSSLEAKSFSVLHELHEMIGYIHIETKSLVHKASNGIAKVTVGSLLIDGLFKIFQKK